MNNTLREILLRPIASIYGLGVAIWNKLYDLDIFRSKNSPIPTIGVGNITVGGTGKTPHTEYLISLLSKKVNIAYLSRGYKRSTKGFYLANNDSSASQIGDEAHQVKNKFKDLTVAVDNDRLNAIKKLSKLGNAPNLIILDDAYQHRKLKKDLNILLIDYNRLTYRDHMLPFGELRESSKNTDRADIIIITKCPDDILPVDGMSVRVQIDPFPYQTLYYTKLKYSSAKYINDDTEAYLKGKEILVITGISQPQHLHEYLNKFTNKLIIKTYNDHHKFSEKEIKDITKTYESLDSGNRIIVTTEKDAARFKGMKLPEILKESICTIGIEIEFIFGGKEKFDQQIIKFLKNQNIQIKK